MKNKGYKPAIERSPELASILNDIIALDDLARDVRRRIERLPDSLITETELRRDFRFSGTAVGILKRFKLLPPNAGDGIRSMFSLKRALRIRLLMPAFASELTIRTVRKRSNIVTVVRDYLLRVIADETTTEPLLTDSKLDQAA